jgi:ectoine hydroxylase-related dioxygenase (phytanoyl-CoA dioxygenase family)
MRDEPITWNDKNWPGSGSIGFFVSYGGCHSQASWFLRTRPRVKEVFTKIWSLSELITSFDTFICWRPWWNPLGEGSWEPFVENLHIDQNPVSKRGFHCVQGMIPLVDVRSDGVGGLQIVPRTNNDKTQEELANRYQSVRHSGSDWLELSHNDPYIGKGQLLECRAGDMLLFDSRTIHGGRIDTPSEAFKEEYENKLARLAMTVTMVPKAYASPEIRKKRLGAF